MNATAALLALTFLATLQPDPEAQRVVAFWREAGPALWFAKDAQFDARFRERFLRDHEAAARGELTQWQATPEGALALVVLLDQFRAMPFAARRACTTPTRWPAKWPTPRLRLATIRNFRVSCRSFWCCRLPTRRTSPTRSDPLRWHGASDPTISRMPNTIATSCGVSDAFPIAMRFSDARARRQKNITSTTAGIRGDRIAA